jgi:rubredoxin
MKLWPKDPWWRGYITASLVAAFGAPIVAALIPKPAPKHASTHYQVKTLCSNCRKASYHLIPMGTNWIDFSSTLICPNCGVKGDWE